MEPGYVLKEQGRRARVLCAAARLGGEAGHRLGEEGGGDSVRRRVGDATQSESPSEDASGQDGQGTQVRGRAGERWSERRRDGSMGRGDGQWPCLRLVWSRGRATAARAPVGGASGARIRSRQACARGGGFAGVRRPCGGKEL